MPSHNLPHPTAVAITDLPWYLCAPCGIVGVLLLALAMAETAGLSLGGGGFVCASFLLLFLSALLVLRQLGCAPKLLALLALSIGLALFLRAFLLEHITYDYQDFLSTWAAFFRENGGWAAIHLPKGDYTTPYLYFLAGISYLPVPDLYLIKLLSILFDFVLAFGAFRLVKVLCPTAVYRPSIAFALAILLPTVLLNGAYWAQCDAIYAALCVHGFAAALEKKPAQSVILVALAFAVKLQTVFLLPLWAVLWFTRRVRFRELLLFPATMLAAIAPALLLGKPLADIVGVYFHQAQEYSSYLTLNAPSVFALIPYGVEVNEARAALFGIIAAFVLVCVLLLCVFLTWNKITDHALLLCAVIFAVGIPLLLPHMHDRYFFLADVLVLVLACTRPRCAPMAIGVQVASLGAYHAYLRLEYLFPMAWGAMLLIVVLLGACYCLWRCLCAPAANPARKNWKK